MKPTRRDILSGVTASAGMAALTQPATAAPMPEIVRRYETSAERLLRSQVTDPKSRWLGGVPDDYGLHHPVSSAGLIEVLTAVYLAPQSRFHKDTALVERIKLAARYLEASQSPQGNIDLLTTNFNSPPDTAFAVNAAGPAANIARRAGATDLYNIIGPFLRKAGKALTTGGIHTPNHRWVVCAALAQLNELTPDPAFVRRIDQWLAEGIDIDEDGQFNERSTSVYNPITDRALAVIGIKLKRPELLEYARRNLDSMLYLLHPGYEVVTEISRRQDQYTRATMGGYWFPLKYLAIKDGNGRYEHLANHFAAQFGSLSALLEYPELSQPGPPPVPPPDDYEKVLSAARVARIRRGNTSATIILSGNSRFLTLRRGEAAVNAVRFASAFFGKAQFVPARGAKRGQAYVLEQGLDGPYYQPLNRKVAAEEWGAVHKLRRRSEVCQLLQASEIQELPNGFRVRIRAAGTDKVPVAIEVNLREGGTLEGCVPAPKVDDGWILENGRATYRAGGDAIRFGPGLREHSYTQVRGAEAKLPGPSVYLCGYTPFDHTLTFEW